MSVPINTRGLISHTNTAQPAPSGVQNTQAPQPAQRTVSASSATAPLAPGSITRDPNTLRHWDTARPILRFDFRTPQEQATFHRAFAQIRTEKDKANFMSRFFDNYDGQVQIPRRLIMDTSRDEEVARQLFDSAPPPPTDADAVLAREVQEVLPPIIDTGFDEEMARRMQGRKPLPRTDRDAEMAQQLQGQLSGRDDARRRNKALNDEAIARRLQQQLDREDQARGYGARSDATGNVNHMADRLGGMSFDGRGPARGSAGQRGTYFGSSRGYERRRPRGDGQAQPQGHRDRNGYNAGPQYGDRGGYGHPVPGQHYYGYEGDDDFEQPFGNGRGGYGPGYSGRGYR